MGGPALVIWCRAVVVSECFLGHWVSAVHLRVDSSGDGWKSCWGCWGPWGQGRLVTGPRSWWRNRQSVVQPWWEAGDSGRNCSLAPVWVCLAVNWEWNQLRQASYYLTSSSFDYLKKVTQCWIENLRYLEALTQRSPFSFLCWASAGQLSPTKVGVAKSCVHSLVMVDTTAMIESKGGEQPRTVAFLAPGFPHVVQPVPLFWYWWCQQDKHGALRLEQYLSS